MPAGECVSRSTFIPVPAVTATQPTPEKTRSDALRFHPTPVMLCVVDSNAGKSTILSGPPMGIYHRANADDFGDILLAYP